MRRWRAYYRRVRILRSSRSGCDPTTHYIHVTTYTQWQLKLEWRSDVEIRQIVFTSCCQSVWTCLWSDNNDHWHTFLKSMLLMFLEWPEISPTVAPESNMKTEPKLKYNNVNITSYASLPCPQTAIRLLSSLQLRSVIGPESGLDSVHSGEYLPQLNLQDMLLVHCVPDTQVTIGVCNQHTETVQYQPRRCSNQMVNTGLQ